MFFMFMFPLYKMLLLLSPPTPCLVRSGGGTEPTMAAVDGGASQASGSGGNGSHHRQLQWVQQNETTIAKETTPAIMVPRSMVAGAMHCRPGT